MFRKHPPRPDCFGLDFGDPKRDCNACQAPRVLCERLHEKSSQWRSLSEVLIMLEDETRTLPGADLAEVYIRYYRQHFGYKPRGALSERNSLALEWVKETCEAEGFDPAMWITAQMHGLRKWLDDPKKNVKKLRFMPSMLRGDKARNRYNIYVEMAHKRYKRAAQDSFDGRTDEGILLAEITGAEERIGDYYVSMTLSKQKPSEEDAVLNAEPGRDWIALFLATEPSPESMDFYRRGMILKRVFGEERLSKLKAVAQVRAAFNVTERFMHGLPDRIGYTAGMRFPWVPLARLLVRIAPDWKPKKPTKDLQEVPGRLWGGSYGG